MFAPGTHVYVLPLSLEGRVVQELPSGTVLVKLDDEEADALYGEVFATTSTLELLED